MYVDKEAIFAIAEKELNIKTTGNEDWCIRWLKRMWRDEITMAICDVKRRKS